MEWLQELRGYIVRLTEEHTEWIFVKYKATEKLTLNGKKDQT